MSKTTTKPVGRKRQVIASVTALAIVGGGVAYAAYLAQMNMRGNIGAGQFVALYLEDGGYNVGKITEGGTTANEMVPSVAADRHDLFKVGTASTYKALDLSTKPREVFPGEKLTIEVSPVVTSSGGRMGYVSGLAGSVPAGWTAKVTKGCGGKVDGTVNLWSTAVTFTNNGATLPLDTSKLGIAVTALGNGETAPVPSSVVCAPLTGTVAP